MLQDMSVQTLILCRICSKFGVLPVPFIRISEMKSMLWMFFVFQLPSRKEHNSSRSEIEQYPFSSLSVERCVLLSGPVGDIHTDLK